MSQIVQEVMTPNPVMLPSDASLREAAEAMSTADIGDVIVTEGDRPCGIVTDRDLVVRGIAAGKDPSETPLRDICSQQLTTVSPKDPIDKAVDVMRQKAIRRLPVADNGNIVGIVSFGDLTLDRAPKSVLADITRAPANN